MSEPVASKASALIEQSGRAHTMELVEWVLRGPGRRIVPKRIYLAAWEVEYALKHIPNQPTAPGGA